MLNEYVQNLKRILDGISDNLGSIKSAGAAMAKTYINNGMVYVFGTGHSHMLGLEMFYRAGGLVKIQPVLKEELMLHVDAVESTNYERISGYAEKLINEYPIKKGDTIIIFSNSGRNAVPVEMAEYCKTCGMTVIGVTNMNQSRVAISRAKSGKKLFEEADIVIDNGGCIGDASISLADGRRIAPTSTAMGAAICNLLEIATVEAMNSLGYMPETFMSSNVDGGELINDKLIAEYKGKIRSL